jgi:thiamine-monophosphate kinase
MAPVNQEEKIFGENEFLHWIYESMPISDKALIPNGDDAALLETSHRGVLVATDMFLDGTHFLTKTTTPELIGRKSIAANFSDIAAMGGWPESVFISLGIPEGTSLEWIERLMIGAAATARQFHCGVEGGDTNTWNGPLAINVCVTGRPHWRGAITRAGAKSGDVVMVSGGSLGHTLETGKHLTFEPRLKEARWILDHFQIHSMMDISDGLAADLPRLAEASKVQITVDARQVVGDQPTSEVNLQAAMCDGEDFELLFTCSEKCSAEILKRFPFDCGIRVIGKVTDGKGVRMIPLTGGAAEPLTMRGYEH